MNKKTIQWTGFSREHTQSCFDTILSTLPNAATFSDTEIWVYEKKKKHETFSRFFLFHFIFRDP